MWNSLDSWQSEYTRLMQMDMWSVPVLRDENVFICVCMFKGNMRRPLETATGPVHMAFFNFL